MKPLSIFAWIAAAGMLALAAFSAWIAWTTAQLPFNSEGRYFDGLEVHLEQSILAYSTYAVVFGLMAAACLWLARRVCARGQD